MYLIWKVTSQAGNPRRPGTLTWITRTAGKLVRQGVVGSSRHVMWDAERAFVLLELCTDVHVTYSYK